jgi:hypothetical protein
MMNTKGYPYIFLTALALLSSATLAQENYHPDKEITCTYTQKKPISSGGAKLGFVGNKIHRLYFNTYYPGDSGKLSFTCDIDWYRDDAAYVWQDKAGSTLITIKETGDTVLLHRKKKGYTLNFAGLNRLSKWCGTGADIPDDVFIPLSGKVCKVVMP